MRNLLKTILKGLLIVGMCIGVFLVAFPLVPVCLLAFAAFYTADWWKGRRDRMTEAEEKAESDRAMQVYRRELAVQSWLSAYRSN